MATRVVGELSTSSRSSIETEAGPSQSRLRSPALQSDGVTEVFGEWLENSEDEDPQGSQQSDGDENGDELGEGMDPEGYVGSSKTVKPLTPEALAAFRAAQERAGVIYISRIPPGMRPAKVRHLMSQYGEVGRVYLQQEGALHFFPTTVVSILDPALI